jgi:hypothetical protein
MACHSGGMINLRNAHLLSIAAASVATSVALGASSARADVGLGLFVGEPFGLDLKLDLQPRAALDLVVGTTTVRDGRADYFHVTYLATLAVGNGRSALVPLRLGIGGAFFDGGGQFADEVNLAVRAPLQVGFILRRSPIEIYGELAIKVTFIDDNNNNGTVDLDGGVGFRLLL